MLQIREESGPDSVYWLGSAKTNNEQSYLYLSKIFNKQNKKNLEEQNLNTVMLLNPKNEEAIFLILRNNQDKGQGSILV